jgi:glycosyltransferase involved in cell wall biosynthesis
MKSAMPPAQKPTIDVVIPLFNGEKYIIAALRSVENQTLPPTRIIIVDDGSTDRSAELISSYQCRITIQCIHQENRGLSAARNRGIEHCDSDYIAFLDADDEWLPQKLAKQLEVFRSAAQENLGIVYCDYCTLDEQTSVTEPAKRGPELRGEIFQRLLGGNLISGSGSSVLIKRECFTTAGLFDEELTACEDWDMWLRIAASYAFDYVSEPLVKIRKHSGNMQKNKLHMFRNTLVFYDKWCAFAQDDRQLDSWRIAIVYRIAEELPGLQSLQLTNATLSRNSQHILFAKGFGRLEVFLLLNCRAIIIIVLKRLLRIKEYA